MSLWENLCHTISGFWRACFMRGEKVMGSLLSECNVLTHSLSCLNLTFNIWDDSGQIPLEVKCRVPKRWEIAEICNDRADEKIDEMVVATVRASKIACEWFIPVTAEPIDNSRVLIKYQPLGKHCKCLLALCWQF